MPCKLSREASQAVPGDRAIAGTLGQSAVRSASGAKGPRFSWDAPPRAGHCGGRTLLTAPLLCSPRVLSQAPPLQGDMCPCQCCPRGSICLHATSVLPGRRRPQAPECVLALSPRPFSFSNFSSFESSQSRPCTEEMMIYLVVRLINVLRLCKQRGLQSRGGEAPPVGGRVAAPAGLSVLALFSSRCLPPASGLQPQGQPHYGRRRKAALTSARAAMSPWAQSGGGAAWQAWFPVCAPCSAALEAGLGPSTMALSARPNVSATSSLVKGSSANSQRS